MPWVEAEEAVLDSLPYFCIKTHESGIQVQRRIVCAANRFNLSSGIGKIVIPASRHYSPVMRSLMKKLKDFDVITSIHVCGEDQGFIDQFDEYHTREVALVIAKYAGQLNQERNGSLRELFSEGLY